MSSVFFNILAVVAILFFSIGSLAESPTSREAQAQTGHGEVCSSDNVKSLVLDGMQAVSTSMALTIDYMSDLKAKVDAEFCGDLSSFEQGSESAVACEKINEAVQGLAIYIGLLETEVQGKVWVPSAKLFAEVQAKVAKVEWANRFAEKAGEQGHVFQSEANEIASETCALVVSRSQEIVETSSKWFTQTKEIATQFEGSLKEAIEGSYSIYEGVVVNFSSYYANFSEIRSDYQYIAVGKMTGYRSYVKEQVSMAQLASQPYIEWAQTESAKVSMNRVMSVVAISRESVKSEFQKSIVKSKEVGEQWEDNFAEVWNDSVVAWQTLGVKAIESSKLMKTTEIPLGLDRAWNFFSHKIEGYKELPWAVKTVEFSESFRRKSSAKWQTMKETSGISLDRQVIEEVFNDIEVVAKEVALVGVVWVDEFEIPKDLVNYKEVRHALEEFFNTFIGEFIFF